MRAVTCAISRSLPDEPKFLKDPPPPVAPATSTPAAKAASNAPASGSGARLSERDRALLAQVTGEAADDAARDFVAFAARVKARTWDADARAPAVPVEESHAGFRITVPGTWQTEPSDPRGLAWVANDQALVSLHALRFTHKTPPPLEYLNARGSPTRDGYLAVITHQLAHPSGRAAAERVEYLGEDARRPFRVWRALYHTDALLLLKLDGDGWVSERVGADYAQAFASLTA